ncbi:MAG: DUF2807 domain-containing protein [Bacteroidales bacterium]|nr:DUF2807 domain-containing protein [Bacteroidales bacterium]
MKNIRLITIALLTSIIITGCDKNGNQTVIGTGDVESMEVDLPAFEGVNVTGTCNVNIQIGEPQSVEFYAQSEILDVLTYKVSDGILQIGFKPDVTVNTSEEIRAEITIPSFYFAGITGAAEFEISGANQFELDIYITGTGNIDAFDMEVDDCYIQITGAGNCEVSVINKLDVVISGVGNVWYMGDPTVTTEVSGVGNVNPAGS